jgi:PAS domain S-box-containing protein
VTPRRSSAHRYAAITKAGIATVLPVAALLVCALLKPWIEPSFEILFMAAAGITAWLCGTLYAIGATALSLMALGFLFAPPSPFNPVTAEGAIRILLFIAANGAVIAVIHQIFQLKRRLRHAEQRHRNLSELIPFGGWISDPDGNMTGLSESFLNAFSTTLGDCLGLGWLKLIHESQREQVRIEWLQCMRSGYFWDYEYTMESRSGAAFSVLSRGVPVRGPAGDIQSWVGIHLDITELERSVEDRLQQERNIARFNAELEQMAYISAHDLQEPLRMIASYLQLLSRRYKGRLDADADIFIEYAVDGANRLKCLLQDLMQLQQVGKHSRPHTNCALGTVAKKAISHAGGLIEETGASVALDELPAVRGDEVELVQLFSNILENAIKYRRMDRAPEIHISAEVLGAEAIVRIRDNGIGIDEQYLSRIFHIFQRLHAKSEHAGTGIGLAICKKIVEVHGGRIWAESRVNEGSTFCFSLPVPR